MINIGADLDMTNNIILWIAEMLIDLTVEYTVDKFKPLSYIPN